MLALTAPPHSLSHATVGLFGLVSIAGAVAARRAGRLADRGQGEHTTGLALGLLVVAWLPLALIEWSLAAVAVGLVLIDLAVQAVHVTNQSMIYAARPEARSRLAGAYMVFYSIGIGGGSVASTATYAAAGWTAVCALGATISLAALAFWIATTRRSWKGDRASRLQGGRRRPRRTSFARNTYRGQPPSSSATSCSTRRAISIACRSHGVDRLALRVGQLPVDVALARDVGAGVAAAHGHDDVGVFGELARESLWPAFGEIDAELVHDVDDLRVNAAGRVGHAAGRVRAVPAARGALEQRLAHLRATRVVQTHEQHVAHAAPAYSIDNRHFNRYR